MATQVPYVAVPPGIASRVGSVFGRTGNVVAEAGDYSAAQIAGGLSRVATTGAAGFALQNATPTILSWTAQNDGNLHYIAGISVLVDCTAAATGGALSVVAYGVGGNASTADQISAGGFGVGQTIVYENPIVLPPGQLVRLEQSGALTAGAATVYAEIWAS